MNWMWELNLNLIIFAQIFEQRAHITSVKCWVMLSEEDKIVM